MPPAVFANPPLPARPVVQDVVVDASNDVVCFVMLEGDGNEDRLVRWSYRLTNGNLLSIK
jgi:hypothetical protein